MCGMIVVTGCQNPIHSYLLVDSHYFVGCSMVTSLLLNTSLVINVWYLVIFSSTLISLVLPNSLLLFMSFNNLR